MLDHTLRSSIDVAAPERDKWDTSPCHLARIPHFTRLPRLGDALAYFARRQGRRLWLKARKVVCDPLIVYGKSSG